MTFKAVLISAASSLAMLAPTMAEAATIIENYEFTLEDTIFIGTKGSYSISYEEANPNIKSLSSINFSLGDVSFNLGNTDFLQLDPSTYIIGGSQGGAELLSSPGTDFRLSVGDLFASFEYSDATGTYFTRGVSLRLVENIGAVPEPATWAMFLLGFGAVGYSMRRRKGTATRISFA